MTASPEKLSDNSLRLLIVACEDDIANHVAEFDDNPHAQPVAEFNPYIVKALAAELTTLRSQLSGMTEETSSDSPRTDDIAASSILYQCADCVRAEADYSCFNAKDVFVIGKEVICRDCADAGHQGEQRRTVPDIAAKLKRQRMAIAHEQRRFAASPASGVRVTFADLKRDAEDALDALTAYAHNNEALEDACGESAKAMVAATWNRVKAEQALTAVRDMTFKSAPARLALGEQP